MKRITLLALVVAIGLSTVGCATKNYVRKETTPVVNKVNELDDLTSRNTRDIKDMDTRAQQGIQAAQQAANAADQRAMTANQAAEQANNLATQASTRVTSLTNTVANLDNYRPVAETVVHFGFDRADLTRKAKEALDQLAAEMPNAKRYIMVVDGNADSTGDPNYNYQLSQRRADSVIQYLASEHSVPAHKIFVIGLGEDKPAASNRSVSGRAKNRRVEVRLMTNVAEGAETSAQAAPPAAPQR